MDETFRGFIDRLRQVGELIDFHQPIDIRHIATLVDQSDKALFFHKVIGYDMPVVSGIIRSRERAMMAMGATEYQEIEDRLKNGINNPIAPERIASSPTREIVMKGDDVDLYKLPIPMSSIYDGGPMITAGVVIARDPEFGINTGTHPIELLGAGFKAPLGTDEMAIAGGIRGRAVKLAACETVDVPYIADAEIVLEAEVLPTGWTHPEGRFGEFTWLMGGLHWNPIVRVKAVSMRRDAVYYSLHMPWENTWLMAPTRYTAIRQALRTAGVVVKDVNMTMGGVTFWHAVISIKKQAGDGKNALLAALSVMDIKHVVVVDDDIDVFNPVEVEWAIATRVQGDRDIMIVSNARGKPLDPSLAPTPHGIVPTTAKVGIDATISEGIPKERYQRITYAYAATAKIADYLGGKADREAEKASSETISKLADEIAAVLEKTPLYFTDVAERFSSHEFNAVARAIGLLHEKERLWQDPKGCLCLRNSAFAAKLPN
jgi:2,5-furandicarboxylate decarboxylase 1